MAHRINVVARTAVLAGLIALAPGAGLQAQMPLDDLRTLVDQGTRTPNTTLACCMKMARASLVTKPKPLGGTGSPLTRGTWTCKTTSRSVI